MPGGRPRGTSEQQLVRLCAIGRICIGQGLPQLFHMRVVSRLGHGRRAISVQLCTHAEHAKRAMLQARKCLMVRARSCAHACHARHVVPRARWGTMSVQSRVDASCAQHARARRRATKGARARAVLLDMHRVLSREGGSMLSARNCALMLRRCSARCFKCFLPCARRAHSCVHRLRA